LKELVNFVSTQRFVDCAQLVGLARLVPAPLAISPIPIAIGTGTAHTQTLPANASREIVNENIVSDHHSFNVNVLCLGTKS